MKTIRTQLAFDPQGFRPGGGGGDDMMRRILAVAKSMRLRVVRLFADVIAIEFPPVVTSAGDGQAMPYLTYDAKNGFWGFEVEYQNDLIYDGGLNGDTKRLRKDVHDAVSQNQLNGGSAGQAVFEDLVLTFLDQVGV